MIVCLIPSVIQKMAAILMVKTSFRCPDALVLDAGTWNAGQYGEYRTHTGSVTQRDAKTQDMETKDFKGSRNYTTPSSKELIKPLSFLAMFVELILSKL